MPPRIQKNVPPNPFPTSGPARWVWLSIIGVTALAEVVAWPISAVRSFLSRKRN